MVVTCALGASFMFILAIVFWLVTRCKDNQRNFDEHPV